MLLSNPTLGSLLDIPNSALCDVRAWPIKGFRNYLIFYRLEEYGIMVLRVLHGARDIERILG
jgi:toxin ParE1/3/4